MAVSLADAKAYLRVDGTAEDAIITQMIASAEAYLAGAIDGYAEKYTADAGFAALADMLELAYIVELYRNRDSINDTRAVDKHFSYMFFAQMTQLQNWVGDAS